MDDEKFKSSLQSADGVESYEQFKEWKGDFLNTYKQHLNPLGTATAREADEELYFELEKLVRACLATKNLVREGKISPDSSTVAGQRTMNEMTTVMKNCETTIENYFPKTKAAEKLVGYTRFELAAVLVRDGFRNYGLMCATRDYLAGLVTEGGCLSEVLQDNQLTIVMYYFRSLEAFQEQMADLGMYQIMEAVQEIYKIRPRGKKKRSKKFDKNGDRDALEVSSDEEVVKEGPMFENKHKKNHKEGVKIRAVMDKGWSNGLAPGEEVRDPEKPRKKKGKKKNNKGTSKKSSGRGKGGSNSLDGDSREGADGDSRDPATENFPSSLNGETDGDNDDDDNKDNTDTTEDEGSSSSEEDEDDDDEDDYIYYFDPVKKVVGKLSRSACQEQKLILKTDSSTGKETFDGCVEEWDSRGENAPGKTELISTMKTILYGR